MVRDSFDQTAQVLVLSGALRKLLAPAAVPDAVGGAAWEVRGAWPELVELADPAAPLV